MGRMGGAAGAAVSPGTRLPGVGDPGLEAVRRGPAGGCGAPGARFLSGVGGQLLRRQVSCVVLPCGTRRREWELPRGCFPSQAVPCGA